MFNLAIVLMTCEPDHLEEWYIHHKQVGFKNFFVYFDSKSISSIDSLNKNLVSEIKNVKIINVENKKSEPIQHYLYTAFCKFNPRFDYVLFIDSDEYYQSKTNNIHEDILTIKNKYGNFDGLGLCWRHYCINPETKNRVSIAQYKRWFPSLYIKSLVNPKIVRFFPGPHFAILQKNALQYINENGEPIFNNKLNNHTSNFVWLKHTRTRSREEWSKKFYRTGWFERYGYQYRKNLSENDSFNIYNSKNVSIDE